MNGLDWQHSIISHDRACGSVLRCFGSEFGRMPVRARYIAKKLSDNTYQITVADETDQAANLNALAGASRFCQQLGMQSQTVSGESSVLQGVNHFLLTFHCF